MIRNDYDGPVFYVSVVLLCGLPSSGKSTFASFLMQEVNKSNSRNNDNEQNKKDCCSKCTTMKSNNTYDETHWINYDEIAETMLLEKIAQQKQRTATTANAYDDKFNNQDDCYYFDQLHLEAWHTARVEAKERLRHLLLRHTLESSTDDESTTSASKGGDQTNTCSTSCGSYNNYSTPKRMLIVLDDNFHLRSMRREIYKQCQTIVGEYKNINLQNERIGDSSSSSSLLRVGFSILVFNTNPSICKERNANRKGRSRVPEQVMNNMISTIEFPPKDECKSTLWIETSEIDFSITTPSSSEMMLLMCQINNLLQNCLQNPITLPVLQPHDVPNNTIDSSTAPNPLHSIDLLLRHIVGITCTLDKSLARQANKARKSILDQYRHQYKEVIMCQSEQEKEETNIHLLLLPKNQYIIYRQFIEALLTELGNNNILPQDVLQKILHLTDQCSP
jgi:tRNA uridine 5-carbamoylmethylation protein Kti12